ncbi:hypothetical protein F480_00205 [Bibersteinia trehalosi Y31]|uniref:Uncharacterized protein n=1 Tax=Bibersteinia trehalosi Y31 TaxID=1261658 RepID=A0A179D0T4_BIBTR|nr:hypothetical protein [Bibersteinia trehalosi]OAQ15784.1 hypothetical protein F480_00205 [Bibersteinia trehalosi Y31]
MTISTIIALAALSGVIGWAVTNRLLSYFSPDNILRLTTIKADGSKVVEEFDLDTLTVEQIAHLRVRLKQATNKKGANNK